MSGLTQIAEAMKPSEVVVTLTTDELEIEWLADDLTIMVSDLTDTKGYFTCLALLGRDYTNAHTSEREFTAESVEEAVTLITQLAHDYLWRFAD
jgi:hypothetical protein